MEQSTTLVEQSLLLDHEVSLLDFGKLACRFEFFSQSVLDRLAQLGRKLDVAVLSFDQCFNA
ncbi:hypothetical protein IU510_14625 [Nocardia cyriacigeorgica]|uniref:hypothetical protein n=1 Tax=Nocardia cyriacigeorgica TaxID=135487 RepID=UPI0018950B65|nr:hypothetical protein [Nocardia cyriacigeorgica]MBF6099314.1 hypothetical protein [Nocardia cyriacigeorgica]